jgi:hypothetical protein
MLSFVGHCETPEEWRNSVGPRFCEACEAVHYPKRAEPRTMGSVIPLAKPADLGKFREDE